MSSFLDVENVIESGGLLLVVLIVFAESGLLIGFMLPGDTLLFAAGFASAIGKLPPLPVIIPAIIAAAIIGDNVGYTIGRRTGSRIFKKKDGLFFRSEYIERAESFYEQHGGKTIVLARFVPVVRTFAPLVAGAAKMERRRFMMFNIIGGVVWGAGVTLLGYWLGSKIPNIDKYLLPIMLGAMLFAFSPTLLHIGKELYDRRKRKTIETE